MSNPTEEMGLKALIVGINKYIDSKELRFADNDAKSVKALIEKLHGNIETVLISDDSEPRFTPLGNNIWASMKLVSQTAEETDNIFFYFAGHGTDINNEPVLLPSDFRDEIGLDTAIKIEDVKKEFSASKAKFKLIILDSCHSGAVKGREKSGPMSRSVFDSVNNAPQGFAIISACGLNQISYEDPKLKHGVFSNFLLEGLTGKADANKDRKVTVNELYDYVTPRVKAWVFKEFKKPQTPHIRANFSGVMVLSSLPETILTEKSVETFGSELFSLIELETEDYEMNLDVHELAGLEPEIEDTLENVTKRTLLILRKTYGISGLQAKSSGTHFKDGRVYRDEDRDERRNEITLKVVVKLKYYEAIWNRIDNVILELDDLTSMWERIKFTTNKRFDFKKIEQLCDEKKYYISDFSNDKPRNLTFETKYFADMSVDVMVTEYDDCSEICISPTHACYLGEHFYTLVNPKKVSELFNDLLA